MINGITKFPSMKRWLSCLLAMCSGVLAAQDASLVDGFLRDAELAQSKSEKADKMWQAGFHSAHSEPAKGLQYSSSALKIAREIGNKKHEGDALNVIGMCYDYTGKPDSALKYFKASLDVLVLNGSVCESASVWSNIGSMYKRRNKLDEGLDAFLKALEIQQSCPDIGYHASTYYSIGTCYNSLENYKKALEYFDYSLQHEDPTNFSKTAQAHNGKANAYLGMRDFKNAYDEYMLGLKGYKASDNKYNEAYLYEGLAQLFEKSGRLDSAIHYCYQALDIFKSMDVPGDIVYESVLLSGFLIKNGEVSRAEKLLLEVLPVSYSEDLPNERLDILTHLSDINKRRGDFRKAFEYLDASAMLRDSLKVDEEKATLAKLAADYETEKRDRIIELEKAESAKQKAENDRQKAENEKQKQLKYFFLAGLILLAALIVVLIGRYRQKRMLVAQLAEQNVIVELEKNRAEKSERMKQQFLANMSHEIRTPMNAITGLSRLLLDRSHDTGTREYLEAIKHSGENLQVILDDILDISKIESGKITIEEIPFDLRSSLNHMIHIFQQRAAAKGLVLDLDVDASIPGIVLGDPSRLLQVINNLVNNAIKFTNEGSVVVIVQRSVNELKFAVKDSGIGIPAEKLDMVFESFVQANAGDTRKYGGTGLGLTIAKELVKCMGGDISVSSVQGKGSVFSFTIPLKEGGSIPAVISESSLSRNKETIHLIIAEDNDYNYLVVHDTILKYFPAAKLYRAYTGHEVIALLEEDAYDLVLMDVQMPEMDGYEATKIIRRQNSELPVIGFTASVIDSDLQRCLESGMNTYVKKPFRDAELVMAIRQYCGLVTSGTDVQVQTLWSPDVLPYLEEKLQQFDTAIKAKDKNQVKLLAHAIRPMLMKENRKELAGLGERIETSSADETLILATDFYHMLNEAVVSLNNVEQP